jgi:hypothetical protein
MPGACRFHTLLACVALASGSFYSEAFAADDAAKPLDSLPATRAPLKASAFTALPLTAVKPEGWLKRQLRIQADGLSGHLDEFWPDVGEQSGWLGGKGESWERGPYYLDGLLPLAHLLGDEKLLEKAQRRIDWAIESQRPDGQFGPAGNDDWWPRMLMCKSLAMHYEATGDARVLPMLTRFFRYELAELPKRPLAEWAKARGGENILVAHWLYNFTDEPFLLDLCKLLFEQTDPWWKVQGEFAGKLPPGFAHTKLTMLTHGVNNAMGLKTAAVMFAQSGDTWLENGTFWGMQNLLRHHGQPYGVFATDEAIRLEGRPEYADALERIAYNAIPATFTEDMWAHQYDQQANQVLVSIAKRKWSNNFDDANIYGLEPNFGCCTANMHQAWPKFVKSLAMASPGGGLAILAYGPCTVRAPVGRGTRLELREETDYPFDGKVRLAMKLAKAERFPLLLHIPAWAEGASVSVNGKPEASSRGGTFCAIERDWADGDLVALELPQRVRLEGGHEGLISVYRGPLLFGLKIGEERIKIRGEAPHCDYEIRPTSAWNYGLTFEQDNLLDAFRVETAAVPENPWNGAAAAVRLTATARLLPNWKLVDHSAGPVTGAPMETDRPVEKVELVPYGATRLRISAFPIAVPAVKKP